MSNLIALHDVIGAKQRSGVELGRTKDVTILRLLRGLLPSQPQRKTVGWFLREVQRVEQPRHSLFLIPNS